MAGSAGRTPEFFAVALGARFCRHQDAEDGAVAAGSGCGAHAQASTIAGKDGHGDPQAESGAMMTFGGEEWSADFSEHGGFHASAVIGNGDAHTLFVAVHASRAHPYPEGAVRRAGFNGIGNQVREDLT